VTDRGAALDLSPGAGVVLDGTPWTVASFEPQFGRVLLRGDGGQVRQYSVRHLLHDPGCRPAAAFAPTSQRGRQPATLADLSERQQHLVKLRYAHVQEAETGFRSGDPRWPAPGEPRSAFDPAATTVGQRRAAKAAKLRALGAEQLQLLGFAGVSERTLRRLADNCRRFGMAGCIVGRWCAAAGRGRA